MGKFVYNRNMKRQAWNWVIGLNKIDGLEISPWMKELIEKEIKGEISLKELEKELYRKTYKI